MRPLRPSRHRVSVLAARAQALREFATVSERRLWVELRSGQLGVSFRRQVVLGGRYIADFYGQLCGWSSKWMGAHMSTSAAGTRGGMRCFGGLGITSRRWMPRSCRESSRQLCARSDGR